LIYVLFIGDNEKSKYVWCTLVYLGVPVQDNIPVVRAP